MKLSFAKLLFVCQDESVSYGDVLCSEISRHHQFLILEIDRMIYNGFTFNGYSIDVRRSKNEGAHFAMA